MNTNMQFKNYWSFGTGINRDFAGVSRSQLRGGPAINYPGAWNNWFFIETDERKKLVFELFGFNNWGDHSYRRNSDIGLDMSWRPHVSLSMSLGPSFEIGHNIVQYVETVDVDEGKRYIIGRIDTEQLSANLRINFSITPDLSIQYWGQPFVFAGDFTEFKNVDNARGDTFHGQWHQFSDEEIRLNGDDNIYEVDENGNGEIDYTFENPDFKVYDFRSNLVLRWEYIPGSALYIVWSQGRSESEESGLFDWRRDVSNLFKVFPHDVFLVKLTYRISV
jgi:hypothetical protein